MQLIYVNMQHYYIDMQHNLVDMPSCLIEDLKVIEDQWKTDMQDNYDILASQGFLIREAVRIKNPWLAKMEADLPFKLSN